MESTKIVGGLCGALLIYLMVNWAGELLYHVGADAHGDEDHAAMPADIYKLETASATSEDTNEGPSLDDLIASADVAKGAKVFSKCKACHKLDDGANGTGPHLFDVVGRAIGGIDGFSYSGALSGMGGEWDTGALDGFLANPRKFAPGTKMSFSGLKKATDRANLIAYLQTIK